MHNNVIMLNPSEILNLIRSGMEEFDLSDNPKFTSRARNVDKDSINRWREAVRTAGNAVEKENPEDMPIYIERIRNINSRVGNESKLELNYRDTAMGCQFLSSTLTEKVGYVTYYKPYMTWYDLSGELVGILSIMTGTSPAIIQCFLARHLRNIRFEGTVEDFSRILLNSVYVPEGYALGLVENMCPTVNNLLNGILSAGHNTGYTLRGQDTITDISYEFFTGKTNGVVEPGNMTMSEIRDVYLCNVLRLICYYILGNIYNIVVDIRTRKWSVDETGRRQCSELLTGWSHGELVFQNGHNRVFPEIEIKGRNGVTMPIHPITYGVEDCLKDYLRGKIAL